MTREEVSRNIYNKTNIYASPSVISILLSELEEMGLIKFESEREAAIKEAHDYLSSGQGYRLDDVGKYHSLIKRLVALLK